MIKSYLRKLRKRLRGGDLCEVLAIHDRDARIRAKQIGDLGKQVSDLAHQVRQLDQNCKSMAGEIGRIGRELTYVAVQEAHRAARIDGNGYRPRP